MRIKKCESVQDVKYGYENFLITIYSCELKKDLSAYEQMANDFYQGVSMLWEKIREKQSFYYVEEDKIIGLLRVEIHDEEVHIAQLTGVMGGGKELLKYIIQETKRLGINKITLCTAEASLVKYYEHFGFIRENPSAETGQMILTC